MVRGRLLCVALAMVGGLGVGQAWADGPAETAPPAGPGTEVGQDAPADESDTAPEPSVAVSAAESPAAAEATVDLQALAGAADPGSAVVLVVQGSSTCAGAFVDASGRVATAYHCVSDGGRARIQTRDGRSAVGRVQSRFSRWDLAIIDVPAFAGEPWLMTRKSPIGPGEPVRAFGHPLGAIPPGGFLMGTLRWSQSSGTVSAVGASAIQFTAPVNKGNSGGPLVDENGHLVGVVSRRLKGDGLGFASRVEGVRKLLDEPRPGGVIGGSIRAEVGVFHWGGDGGVMSYGGRVEASIRDRVVFGVGGAMPWQPTLTAIRSGRAAWQSGDVRLGVRQRLARGYWTSRVDLYGGVAAIQTVVPQGEPIELRTHRVGELAPMAGVRLAVGMASMDMAAVRFHDETVTRAMLAFQWPGRIGIY